ncbi:hypothetical protein [Oscillatoria sp. FACHB-1406]|uniref:hypothetical protein n=1 Tax=Oscillatoria sp. FACHB-1406 TaxID=2692846 RepID=UPI00168401A3|nr:hypothetical protein [Oscillatoria sp. FACHB-1406]MBD2578281.1 hypothetical protein [Oscillatoria sp. FACHB-1406]
MFGLKGAYLKLIAVLGAIAILGFSTVGHYGVSWDEGTEISTVKYNYELIAKGREIPKDLRYYGVLFNFSAEVAYQVREVFRQGVNYNPLKNENLEEGDRAIIDAIAERIKVKHPFTFFVALFAYGAVGAIVGILAGWEYAWTGAIALVLFPRFWGHSFFNPKDIPFAALFTLATVLGAYLIQAYLQAPPERLKLGKNRLTLYSFLYGILVAAVTGIRIGGFFLLFFVALAHLLVGLGSRNLYAKVFRFYPFYLLMGLSWAAFTILFYPSSWSNPIAWFFATLHYLSKHTWPGKNLFAGQLVTATGIPRYYLPQWLHLTIPVIFQIAFIGGLISLIWKYRKLDYLQKACTILTLLQIFTLPAIAIIGKSPLYNAERQFLFVLPGVAAIAVTAALWFYQSLARKAVRWFFLALTLVLLSPIAVDMVTLHPYEYVYFNRLAGGLSKTYGQYDRDYWGLALREGMEWINRNAEPNSQVAIGGEQILPQIYAVPHLKFLDIDKDLDYGKKGEPPNYYLAMHYMNLQNVYPNCPVVYEVMRQGSPLATVKKCKRDR